MNLERERATELEAQTMRASDLVSKIREGLSEKATGEEAHEQPSEPPPMCLVHELLCFGTHAKIQKAFNFIRNSFNSLIL